MGLGDMAKKAKDALSSEKGEQVSDQVLDRGADLANRVTGGKHADKIERGRDAVDERVGTPGPDRGTPGPDRTDAGGHGGGTPTPDRTAGRGAEGGTDGVNAVGTTGGSDHGSGNTTAGATHPGPDADGAERTGRHRA